MYRTILIIACLLIIDEFTLQLRRRYIERRQLRWWQSRIRGLRQQPAPLPAITLREWSRSRAWWAATCAVALLVSLACAPAAEHGNVAARVANVAGAVTFWGIVIVALLRRGRSDTGSAPEAGVSHGEG